MLLPGKFPSPVTDLIITASPVEAAGVHGLAVEKDSLYGY
jgi:hypothetical protein